MMEQLGNEPAPCAAVAAGDIKMYIFTNKHRYLTNYSYDSNQIETLAYKHYSKYFPPFSLAAYYSGGMAVYANEVVKQYIARIKVRNIIKNCALLYMIFRRSQEKIYAPGGPFEKEAAQRWKQYINEIKNKHSFCF